MNRYLKALGVFALITFFAACKSDDDTKVVPPRDYGEQYAAEKPEIENYLKTHFIASVDEDMNIDIQPVTDAGTQVSIWDQEEYPLLNKIVNSNNVEYTVYYLVLREGVGEAPTRADDILTAYRGTLFDGTQFDYRPFPDTYSTLTTAIEGWQEIIPMFKTGIYVDIPGSPDPAHFEDFGAGVMFLPSGLAYFNRVPLGTNVVPAYASMIFSFKLFDLEYIDNDADGILSKDETIPGTDIKNYDTDGDGVPNYLDADDDNDGYSTRTEITIPDTNPAQLYEFDAIPACNGGTVKKHLDPACH